MAVSQTQRAGNDPQYGHLVNQHPGGHAHFANQCSRHQHAYREERNGNVLMDIALGCPSNRDRFRDNPAYNIPRFRP